MLELFSGTGSVGKVAEQMGITVISLDKDMEADLQCDIMDWDYRELPRHMFDIIWASPPCTEYSRAKTCGVRDIEGANKIVKRTLDIIEYFKPKYWIIENPQTGLLKDQSFMHGIPYNDLDYCKYGMPYRKRTRLWNNVYHWQPKPLCVMDCDTMNITRNRHTQQAQQAGTIPERRETHRKFKTSDVNESPTSLIRDILDCCDMSAPNGTPPNSNAGDDSMTD